LETFPPLTIKSPVALEPIVRVDEIVKLPPDIDVFPVIPSSLPITVKLDLTLPPVITRFPFAAWPITSVFVLFQLPPETVALPMPLPPPPM
jgi:hypothetical protein